MLALSIHVITVQKLDHLVGVVYEHFLFCIGRDCPFQPICDANVHVG